MVRLVVTMTTLPNRYNHLHETLKSLHRQTVKADAIYVTIPRVAKRSGITYPPLTDDILPLCTPVYIDIDYGPICKLMGALIKEEDALILSVDDDCLFPNHFIETFLKKHKLLPNVAITGTGLLVKCGLFFTAINTTIKEFEKYSGLIGFNMPGGQREVSIVQGVSGVLYKRSFFKDFNSLLKLTEDEDLFKSDDILISAYLSQQGIKIYTFHDMPLIPGAFDSPDALSSNVFKMLGTFKRAFYKCVNLGMFKRFAPCSIVESPVFKIPLVLLCIVILIIIFIYILLN